MEEEMGYFKGDFLFFYDFIEGLNLERKFYVKMYGIRG